MASNSWEWLGGSLVTVVGSSEAIAFTGPGGAFSTPLLVGNTLGQEGTHVRHVVAGTSGGELPNCQYANGTQAVVNGSTVSVGDITPTQCTIRVRLISAGAGIVSTTNSFFDAYGTDTTKAPADGDVTIYGFERSNTVWSALNYPGSNRLSLISHAVAAMTHDWYIGLSTRATAEGTFDDINFRVVTEYYS